MSKYEEIKEEARTELMKSKSGALWVGLVDLGGLVNINEFSKRFLNKSGSWMQQRIHNYNVNGKEVSFKREDYEEISKALRTFSKMMMGMADAIDKADN